MGVCGSAPAPSHSGAKPKGKGKGQPQDVSPQKDCSTDKKASGREDFNKFCDYDCAMQWKSGKRPVLPTYVASSSDKDVDNLSEPTSTASLATE